MISPISAVSGYSVQAIYGNPVSVRPVKPVSEDSTANRAMMTVSKNQDIDVPSQPSKEILEKAPEKSPVKSVASGGEAEIVKQLEQLQKAISKPSSDINKEEEDEFDSIQASMSSVQNQFSNQFTSDYSDTLLQMGYQQNIRDKVSSSSAQSQIADITQRAYEPQTVADVAETLKTTEQSQAIESVQKETESVFPKNNVSELFGVEYTQ